MTIPNAIHISFQAAVVLYTSALVCRGFKKEHAAVFVFSCGLICNGISLVLRYLSMLPLLPLFQGPFFIPFALGALGFTSMRKNPGRPFLFFLVTILAWAAYLFPNDFYLPLLQFRTPFSHGLFIFGIIGKALFLLAGESALAFLIQSFEPAGKQMGNALLWGFFFWTLSVFSGAVWSWLGWGSPLVWDDPVIAVSMATWLIYALVLHLHLTRFSSLRARAGFTAAAAVWVICLGIFSELGPLRLPGWGS